VSLFVVTLLGTHELASKREPSDVAGSLVPSHPRAVALMDSFEGLSDRKLVRPVGPSVESEILNTEQPS